MYLVSSLISVLLFWVSKEFLSFDTHLERIKECVPEGKFFRKGTKEKYTYFQFVMDGKDVNVPKIENRLKEYLGKPVKVFFDRVLTIRVYTTSLPTSVKDIHLNPNIIGVGLDGFVEHDFERFPHMIVAGTTGYGKTNFLKTMMGKLVGGILYIDLKKPGVGIHDVRGLLDKIDLKKGREERLFVIIDEAAELLPPKHLTRKEASPYLECLYLCGQIARLGRELNVSLIYCTQYPTSDVLPREIKQNAEARVIFRLPTEVASRVALDENGADKLPRGLRGRALYKTDIVQEIQTFEFDGEEERGDFRVEVGEETDSGTKNKYTLG